MLNRVRTLLLNERPDPGYPYGEEAVPSGYVPKSVSRRLSVAYAGVFGRSRDRASKNWTLGMLAPVLTSRAAVAAQSVLGVTPANTFWPSPQCRPPDWSAYGTVAVQSGGVGFEASGVPEFGGPAAVTFDVEAVLGGSVTVRVPNGMFRTVTPPYAGGRSAVMTLAKGVRFSVPEAGGRWQVTAVSRLRPSLADVYSELTRTGLWLLDETGLRPTFDSTGHQVEKLAVLVVALAESIARSVVTAADNPVPPVPTVWPDFDATYWPDNTPVFWA